MLQSGDGEAYLGILIRPPADAAKARPPVALAMVIDTSGSMESEQKIENARHAATSTIKALGERDHLTMTFSGKGGSHPVDPLPLHPCWPSRASSCW